MMAKTPNEPPSYCGKWGWGFANMKPSDTKIGVSRK